MVLIACSTELYSCFTLAVFLSNLTYRKEQHQNEQDDNIVYTTDDMYCRRSMYRTYYICSVHLYKCNECHDVEINSTCHECITCGLGRRKMELGLPTCKYCFGVFEEVEGCLVKSDDLDGEPTDFIGERTGEADLGVLWGGVKTVGDLIALQAILVISAPISSLSLQFCISTVGNLIRDDIILDDSFVAFSRLLLIPFRLGCYHFFSVAESLPALCTQRKTRLK